MQGKNWIRTQGGRLESTSSSSSRLRRPLFSEGPSFVSPPLNQEPSDNLPRLQYINPVFGSPSSSTSSAHSLTPHPSTSPTRSLPSSPFLEDPPSIPLIHQQSLSSPSTSSPSVHMADEVENNQNQNNDIKDLLHHLVSGQAQMREDFQQMFQHLLARDNKPEGSNHEGPVGGNEENTTPISDFEKRMDKRMEQMEKMPSFDKFDSTSCPVSHLKMYVRAMQPLGADDSILAQMFQSSLTGSALKWFMKLGEAHTRTWEDICAEFTRYFNYNNEVDVTRRDLETTKQDPKETFSAFITRWRAKAAHMPNRPNEEEQLQIVAGTQIEDAIEVGIVKVEDFQRAKKFTPIGSSSKVQEIAVISKPNPIQLSFPKAPRQYNDLYMPPSKNAIQDLIDNEIISPPTPPNRPNVNHNPLPNHHNQRPHINCIEDQEMGDPSLLIHKIPSCNMLSWDELMEDSHPSQKAIQAPSPLKPTNTEAESPNTFLNQTQNSPEITHITRGGRHFKPPHLEADNPLEALSQQAPQPTLEDDLVLKQLQKTQANISLWSLLMASYSHRQAILKLLNQVQIPTDISPEALSAMIGTISQDSVIAFSDKDLPINGTNHNEALNITVDIGENRVPMVLIDNGSALNVCTLKTTICLGINRSEFLPSNQFVKAYDDTKREVHGVVILNISIGPMVQKVHFQVMDITASFNMLLGRPWLHETKAISSSLHQKVRFPYKGSIVTVHGDTQITPSKGPVLEIEPVDGDLVLSGFDFEEVHALVLATETPEFFPIYYDPYSNDKVVTMIRGMGYFPGMGLGRKDQGIAEFQDYPKAIPTFGLGYKPTEEELLQKKERFLARIEAQNKGLPFDPIPMKPYTLTLNGKFVKEGEEHPYHGFPEPWKNKSANQKMPGFEIFFNNQLDIEDLMQGIEKIEVKDWAEEMDGIAMEELLDGTVHMLGEKIDKDPSLLIGPTKDPLTNWVWGNGFANGDYKEEAKSTEFGPSLEFESVSRFNVKLSPVFDSESMSKTPPTEERLVKPIKEEIESVNIGTNDEPKMMQIGKNLTPFEKDEFIALLQEFQEVFAWSYEDMPGIDTDIVQHSIPTDPTFRPVKQKLRRMKPEWTLKIKEEVEKQYNAGFLKVVNYPEWLANVVPVPKKDGKVRMCVDFRDLNKASPKDDFPLPHIDVLVDNTARHAMLSFMDGFSGYNQIKMAPEDMEKTSFITPWGTYCYKVMPFGLKNAGATYQRAATTLLHDMIHKECMFGVTSGKLLGFIVSQRGIEVDPDKIKAILEMKEPRTEKEIRGFLGRIQYISRFIAQLTTICEPMFKLLKKDVPVKWNNQCQVAFDRIKNYLLNPPILMPPLQDKPLLLYLSTTDTAMGALLAQYIEESRKENAIYYLSKKMTEGETKYSTLEKTCVALVWATQKLRHYLLSFPVLLLARLDPLKYLLEKPIQDGKTAKWIILLTEFDITYVTQKSIKGGAIAEHLAQCPSEEAKAIRLRESKVLEVYGDSALIIRQAQKKWKVKEEKLQPYLEKLDMLTEQFDNLEFQYIPRNQNQFADALATLASMIDIPSGVNLKPLMIEQREQPAYCCTLETFTEEENIWYHDIHQYLKGGSYPLTTSKVEKQTIRRLAMQYILCGEKLYRRSYEGVHLLCVTKREGEQIIEDIHEGAYGPHMNAHMLSRKILRLGYYWTTMEADCAAHVRRCHKCQIHGNLKHMPPMPLYSMSSPWPFATWGIDIIGKIVPKASNGHEFILVAIDYFTKWVEAASFKILNSKKVAQFIRTNIICRYGVPHEVISDNGSHFRDETEKLLHEYKIKHHKSSPYRPQTNGAVEAANKNVEMILRKNAEKHRNWHERLPYALWGYRTSIRTATGATPYSLVYGMEAVLPIELEIQSLRVVMEEEIPETEWLQERYNQLNMMEEKRLRALYNTQGYQRRAMRAFNKKVKPRNIKIGDMVLKEIRAPVHDPRGKFKPNWSGPFIVKEIYSGGAARLIDIDGNPFTEPTNLDQLKKYFV
uniref:Uncharacterized protein n=1 Tax=Fagus sylvatica TaxID=28930 RepID=A0A2N9EB75_FAGSY